MSLLTLLQPSRGARAIALGGALAVGPAFVAVGADAPPTLSVEMQSTIVKSDRLEMRNTGVEGHYVFIGHVRITGTNLEVTCDRVEVFAVNKDEPAQPDSAVPGTGNIRRLLATGNVTIAQKEPSRKATCGTAEVLPKEGRIILTDSPVITDIATGVTMKGTRMTVFRDERYANIENSEVVGPALPNLGVAPSTAAPTAPPLPSTVAP